MKIIECDVDGVLLDIYTPVENELKKRGIDFSFNKSVKTWSMREVGPLRKELLAMLLNAQLRSQAQWYTGAKEFLIELNKLCKDKGYNLVLNTHETYYDAACVKAQLLNNLIDELNIDCTINVQCSKCKEMLNSYVCIDDSLDNIQRSKAKLPLLFSSFHNTELYNGYRKGIKRVNGYNGVLNAIYSFDTIK